jgi:hypothetical protein
MVVIRAVASAGRLAPPQAGTLSRTLQRPGSVALHVTPSAGRMAEGPIACAIDGFGRLRRHPSCGRGRFYFGPEPDAKASG